MSPSKWKSLRESPRKWREGTQTGSLDGSQGCKLLAGRAGSGMFWQVLGSPLTYLGGPSCALGKVPLNDGNGLYPDGTCDSCVNFECTLITGGGCAPFPPGSLCFLKCQQQWWLEISVECLGFWQRYCTSAMIEWDRYISQGTHCTCSNSFHDRCLSHPALQQDKNSFQ